uniref:DUF2817 domain-containing protein n=1 Tax=Lotharella oceanica TaxID=641309 RepID=A0A7S2X6X9_9EUKA|mmetsp:Transcript_11772/g.22691  ORF Transcript_11772/g.22691 Transcript_11772/m.22691 type:complete len:396 (+) Transcript_11772:33-1220(+)
MVDSFSIDYLQAKTRFVDLAKKINAHVFSLELKGTKGPKGEALTIDLAVLGDVKCSTPKNILLHTSGVHGVEGFAGSAIQIDLLSRLRSDENLRQRVAGLKGTKIVIVHAVNPYGMAWIRKFNENNVDLNRNFHLKPGSHKDMLSPEKRNTMYRHFYPTMVPSSLHCCEPCCFYGALGYFICRYGYGKCKRGLASGQHEFQKGPFYGGLELEPGPRLLVAELEHLGLSSSNRHLTRVLHVDVHTGLGRFGEDTLLFDDVALLEPLRSIFGRSHVVDPRGPHGDLGALYETPGSCDTLAPQLLADAPSSPTIVHVCQEFGTLDNISVLRAMVREGVAWHADRRTPLSHRTKIALRGAFFPEGDAWKERVIARGRAVLEQSLAFVGLEKGRRDAKAA